MWLTDLFHPISDSGLKLHCKKKKKTHRQISIHHRLMPSIAKPAASTKHWNLCLFTVYSSEESYLQCRKHTVLNERLHTGPTREPQTAPLWANAKRNWINWHLFQKPFNPKNHESKQCPAPKSGVLNTFPGKLYGYFHGKRKSFSITSLWFIVKCHLQALTQ